MNALYNISPKPIFYFSHNTDFITFAGIPPTITLSGTSFVTTAPAATIEFFPTVTPARIVAFAPIHAFFFIRIGEGIIPLLFSGSEG